MPNAPLTQDQRLKKFKISNDRFHTEHRKLQDVGFTSKQAESLIMRQSSANTVAAVMKSYRALLRQPYALTYQQIIIIAGHGGGSKNIKAVKNHYQALIDKGYYKEQLVSMLARNNGSKKIYRVIEAGPCEEDSANFLFLMDHLLSIPSTDAPHQELLESKVLAVNSFQR